MNAKEFEKYAGKNTKGKKGNANLSGGKIIGYDPKDVHHLQLFAIDDIHGDSGKTFEVVIPDKDDLKDYLCGKHKYIWVTIENVIMDELNKVMETRNVKVTLETAQRWYGQGGEFKEMALSAYSEAELNPVKNEWESKVIDYGTKFISGWYLGDDYVYKETNEENTDRSTFKTEKQAKSALAYAQLTQLMALPEYNGDWVPDWSDGDVKYIIRRYRSSINLDYYTNTHHFLAFKSEEIRNKFHENNLDLLKEYFELD